MRSNIILNIVYDIENHDLTPRTHLAVFRVVYGLCTKLPTVM